MHNQVGVRAFARNLKHQAPQILERMPEIPMLAHSVLKQLQQGTLKVESKPTELIKLRREIHKANRRTVSAITGSSLIISAILLLGMSNSEIHTLGDLPFATWVLGITGAILLFISWPLNEID